MRLKLIKKFTETPDVKSFFWETSDRIKWEPGQYFYYTLPNLSYPDKRGETRHFTISNSPTEKVLKLTTKFPNPTSGFKKTLDELPIGAEINGRGPQGTFTLSTLKHKAYPTQLFLAGGIGITPFRSMIKYVVDKQSLAGIAGKKLDLPYLIYSNSDENFVFKKELEIWLGKKVVFYDSSVSGHIDEIRIQELIKNLELEI